MIDITHPFHKTLWFMEEYTKGSKFSFLEGNKQGKTSLDFLEEILSFEVEKEKYKKSLLQHYSFDNILHFEHSNIEYTLEALKEEDSVLYDLPLRVNYMGFMIESNYTFTIKDCQKIWVAYKPCKYFIFPKIVATGHLRMDEYPIVGPLKFINTMFERNENFRIIDILKGVLSKDVETIDRRIRKMLLCQLLIIDKK